MWETLAPPWQACLEETWDACCAGNVPIGAVITDANGEIVARGRNRREEPHRDDGYVHANPLAHAELNALLALPREIDSHLCTLYTVTEPCPLCLGAFYMSGMRKLHYASRDPYAGSVNLLGKTPYLSRKPIQVHGPQRIDLEIIIMGLYVDYALRGEVNRAIVLDEWKAVVPESVPFGERIFHSGVLTQMRADKAAAPAVFTELHALLENSGIIK